MRLWKLDDCDYVAGESLAEVVRWYEAEIGQALFDPESTEECALSMQINAAEEGEPEQLMTAAEWLTDYLERGGTLPVIMGSDE